MSSSTAAGRDERAAFAARLAAALSAAGHRPSASVIGRALRERGAGGAATIHAARKWLGGETIPRQDTLRALAEWLRVGIGWLRFGETETEAAPLYLHLADSADELLLEGLRRLNEQERHILTELIALLRSHSDTGPPPPGS